MSVEFSQKWVKKAVQKLFGEENIEWEDLEKIKYLSIGESFNNDFFIEMSLEIPPKPFVDTEGGDEWMLCLRGEDISRLVDDFKVREGDLQIYMFGLEREDENWMKYARSVKARKLWKDFAQSLHRENYYEEHDEEEFEKWYDGVAESMWQDITLFSGVEVLRIKGLKIPDFSILKSFPGLRTAEFVETVFQTAKDIERLNGLEQLSCYLD